MNFLKLEEAKKTYNQTDFAKLCGVSRQAINTAIKKGMLLPDKKGKLNLNTAVNNDYYLKKKIDLKAKNTPVEVIEQKKNEKTQYTAVIDYDLGQILLNLEDKNELLNHFKNLNSPEEVAVKAIAVGKIYETFKLKAEAEEKELKLLISKKDLINKAEAVDFIVENLQKFLENILNKKELKKVKAGELDYNQLIAQHSKEFLGKLNEW